VANPQLFPVNVPELGISLSAPEGWQAGGTSDFQLFMAAPPDHDFRANIGFNVVQSTNATPQMLDAEIANLDQQQAQQYKNYRQAAVVTNDIDGRPARLQFYEWLHEQSNTQLSQIRGLILRDPNTLYVISASSLKQLEANYIPLMQKVINSIKFI
jgi:hypothetical protein